MRSSCLLLQGNFPQDTINQKLGEVQLSMSSIESALHYEKKAETFSSSIREDNDSISKHLKQLSEAAGILHSSADFIIGPEKLAALLDESRLEEPLGKVCSNATSSWTPTSSHTKSRRSGCETPVSKSETIFSREQLLSSPPTTQAASDSESDTENDMFSRIWDLAVTHYKAQDYAKAETFLTKLTLRSPPKSTAQTHLVTIRIMLAYAYGAQEKWTQAEQILLSTASLPNNPDTITGSTYHTLALIFLQNHAFTDAIHFCRRARSLRRKTFGKTGPPFYESMLLLAQIHEAEGDVVEAEICRTFVPLEERRDVDIEPLSYLAMLVPRDEDLGSLLLELDESVG